MNKRSEHAFVILAYKQSPYLEACIRSLKNQTIKSTVYISTSTPSAFLNDIAKKHDIPVMINPSSEGIARDWSFAYNNCNARYVTLSHQDDIYYPSYTKECLSAVRQANNDAVIIFTGYNEIRLDAIINTAHINVIIKKLLLLVFACKKNIYSRFFKRLTLSFGNPVCCPSVMYHKEKIGNFNFSADFVFNMDWDAWLRLADNKGCFVYLSRNLMAHRIHADSQTSSVIKNNIRAKEELILFKRLWPAFTAHIIAWMYGSASQSNTVGSETEKK